MIKRILPVIFALTIIILAACGAQGTPTMAPADVEGTAVSAAWTMVAATLLANPTATSLPPTEIPSPTSLPTFTPVALLELPTLLPTLLPVLPTSTTASGTNNCLGPIDFGQAGKTCRVRVENESGGSLRLSLNLQPNAFGQCGVIVVNVAKNAKEIVQLPVGNYWGFGWVESPASTPSGSFVLGQGCEDLLVLKVGKDTLSIKGP